MILACHNLDKSFGDHVIVKSGSFHIEEREKAAFVGVNGAGKSTFLKILTGEIEPNTGEVFITPGERMSVLAQNQNAYDSETVLDTVLLGHKRLMEVQKEKDALYAKPDFTDEDGIRAGELETEFAELGGWEADSNAKTLLQSMGINEEDYYKTMAELDSKIKVKVLLAQALFGNPDILILDEPTSGLDPFSRDELLDLFAELKRRGVAVLFSTHITSDIEKCADDILYIRDGKLVANCSMDDFRKNCCGDGESLEEAILRMERGVRA